MITALDDVDKCDTSGLTIVENLHDDLLLQCVEK